MHLEIEATDKTRTQGDFDWICKPKKSKMPVNLSNTTKQSGRHVLFLDFCEPNGTFSLMHSTGVDVELPSVITYLSSAAQHRKL